MRIGVLGGSFDPPHFGHLGVAGDAARALTLDRVILVPSAIPPHKLDRQLSPSEDRLEMCRLAVSGNPLFEVSDVELKREGISFTVDTLDVLSGEYPGCALFLLIGMDNYREFHLWRNPGQILRLATVAVMGRPGYGDRTDRIAQEPGIVMVDVRKIDISSTAIRERVRAGESVGSLVPDLVATYIQRRGLYR